MTKLLLLSLFSLSILAMSASASAQDAPEGLNFKMKDIKGKEFLLGEKYKGKAVVFVNVASRCGYTPQYKDLQALHEKYADQGLAVVGVPCNQFGRQEPGSEAEIIEFCQSNYGVEFDMLSKVDVNGDKQCPLYKYLTAQDLAPKGKGPIRWNFEKIVVDRSGKPVARFASSTKPMSDEFVKAVESALK